MVINMYMDKADIIALSRTVELTGFAGALRDLNCIAHSKADPAGNKDVRAKANELLLESLIKDEIGHCIHITGEMRALADPFHRRLCAELVRRSSTRFTVIYNLPENYQKSPELVGKWTTCTWAKNSWIDKLSAFNLVGESFVDVRAFNTEDEIQYSVFGNWYVLLQEKHLDNLGPHDQTPKRVWLLKSKKFNDHMNERAQRIISKSKDIPEILFKQFSAMINGVSAQNIMQKLAKYGGTAHLEQVVDDALRNFDTEIDSNIEILQAVGFIKIDDENKIIALTKAAHEYIGAINERR